MFYAILIKENFCLINTDHINKEKAIVIESTPTIFSSNRINMGNHSVLIDSVEMLLGSLIFEILLTFDDQKKTNNEAATDNTIHVDSIYKQQSICTKKNQEGSC